MDNKNDKTEYLTKNFDDSFYQGSLTRLKITQNGNETNSVEISAGKNTKFTVEISLNTYMHGENRRKFKIDLYGFSRRGIHFYPGNALESKSADISPESMGSFTFNAEFDIPDDKLNESNYSFIGLDIFFLISSLKDGSENYSPFFKTLIPIVRGESIE